MSLLKRLMSVCLILMVSTSVWAIGEYVGERNAFNRFHGKGVYTYTNGNVYEGEWVDGRKNGVGSQTWSSGERYEGSWNNNREHGTGTKSWPDGTRYQGDWVNGKMMGTGTYYWANGDSYTGGFVNDHKQGAGAFKQAATQLVFEGRWEDDQRTGPFVVKHLDGTAAEFNWADAKKVTKAEVTLLDGSRFIGPLNSAWLPHGAGRCSVDGKARDCRFSNGKKVEAVVAKAKPAPVEKPAPIAKPKPPLAPVAKAFKPDVPIVVAQAKPVRKAESQDPRTLRGVRDDGSQFFFVHSWGGISDDITQVSINREVNDFGSLLIKASGPEFEMQMLLDEYVGKGRYELKYFKASISRKGEPTIYRTSGSEPGEVIIIQDGKGMMMGTFSFVGYPQGNAGNDKRTISEGEFAILLQ